MTLSHHRGGAGAPLLLLHGIGSQWQVWTPVLPALEARHDVIAADLPGFGGSPVLPDGVEVSPRALTDAVAAFLDELGLDTVHVAGNSLGGWVGLELAKRGRTRSLCALSPAGFWTPRESAFAAMSLRSAHAAATLLGDHAERILASPNVRKAANAQLVAHADRMPVEAAAQALRNLAASPGWDATLRAMRVRAFEGGEQVRGPVTIAWGEKDRLLLPRQATRARAALPHARHLTLAACGHVPTWDDPAMVADAILTSG